MCPKDIVSIYCDKRWWWKCSPGNRSTRMKEKIRHLRNRLFFSCCEFSRHLKLNLCQGSPRFQFLKLFWDAVIHVTMNYCCYNRVAFEPYYSPVIGCIGRSKICPVRRIHIRNCSSIRLSRWWRRVCFDLFFLAEFDGPVIPCRLLVSNGYKLNCWLCSLRYYSRWGKLIIL